MGDVRRFQPFPSLSLALAEPERHQLQVEWNDTAAAYPGDRGVHELFSAQAERAPEATAVAWDGGRLAYRELEEHSNRLAHHLRRMGVTLESPVGVCLERSPEMMAGLLAVLKAGGAYVPLDPGYPQERQRLLLADTGVRVALAGPEAAGRLAAAGVAVADPAEAGAGEPGTAPESGAGGDHLAYVLFTSGSTGRPKGVAVSHRNILRLVFGSGFARFGPDEVFLHMAPPSFDASTFEIWGCLLHGGKLVLAPASPPSLAELGDLLRRHGVTTLWLTAGLFHQVVDHAPEALGGIRQLLAGGDVLSAGHVRRALERLAPGGRLINGYGPTESTTFACCCTLSNGGELEDSVPIGSPIGNTEAHVLDADLRPVPVGTAGELYLGGDGLARGYLGQPALTAERFVPHPYGRRGGERLYRTGDRVRRRADGRLEFLGRLDRQVKVRGFRIEPGEIEAALLRHGGVREAVVVARPDRSGDKSLAAYVVAVPEEAEEVSASALREHLAGSLPAYMVPSAVVLLTQLPLTPNGKIDREALPDPASEIATEETVAPRNPVEEVVAGIFCQLFGRERVGVHDDFFALGGHSLLATQLLTRLRSAFGRELPLEEIFASPTPVALARWIQGSLQGSAELATEPIGPVPRCPEMPVSFAQERICFLERLAPEMLAYNFQASLRFTGPLAVPALAAALDGIVHRHEIFRTTFPMRQGRPVQTIHPSWSVPLPLVDLSGLLEGMRPRELEACLAQELRRPFDLQRLPLIRWTLLRLTGREHLLVHVEHHLLHDGWSFNVFLRELAELYTAVFAGAGAGAPSTLPALPLQFADFAAWQRRWLEGSAAEAQLAYWQEKLAGSPPVLSLPLDHPRPAVQRFRGAAPRFELPAGLYADLRAFGDREGITLFMTLLSSFVVLLHRYSGQEDLCVGSGIANRRWRETEGLIGMVINMVVLRTDASGDPTFRELLARVRRMSLEAYAHQDLPFEKIVEALRPERDLSYNPFFQVSFSFHDAPLEERGYPGLEVEVTEGLSNGSAKFDLNVIAIPRAEQRVGSGRGGYGITLLWEHNTDLFERTTIERMAGHYRRILGAILADPGQRLSEIPLMDAGEEHQVRAEWNDTAAPPGRALAHERVAALAARQPDRPAVVQGERSVTYGDLNRRANQLARFLQAHDAGPDRVVALCMQRSADLVAGALAVLKAGAAYLPIDPDYPPERIAYLLEDAAPVALLTHGPAAAALPPCRCPVVRIDAEPEPLALWSEEEPPGAALPDDVAYVIYTSGSTGRPKGVKLRHAGLANLIDWHLAAYGLGSGDRTTQVASPGFDAAVWEVWPCLAAGASLHVPAEEVRSSPASLALWLAEQEITRCFLPTPLAEAVLDEPWPAGIALRSLLTGGDRLQRRPSPGLPFRLVNHYGPTEDTVVATSAAVAANGADAGPPIGRPIANQRTYVVDRHLRLVPLGVAGELVIGGAGLARGYLGQPRLTAEKLMPDPFGSEPGGRLYRTEDLVRWRFDGQLEFLGRIDRQVKVRGFRIEPGEIEGVLREHPGVRDGLVVARNGLPGGRGLVAYVVPEDPAPGAEELLALLKGKVPAYMVPAAFVFLPSLPLSPNGKVDVAALPDPEAGVDDYVPPEGPVEELLAEIWSESLGVGRVGARDNFFRLGGHSLRATQVLSRLAEALQVEVPLRELFEAPTLKDLAAVVEDLLLQEIEDGAPGALVGSE